MQTEVYIQNNDNQANIVAKAQTVNNAVYAPIISTDRNNATYNNSSDTYMPTNLYANSTTDGEKTPDTPTYLENRLISLALTDEKVLGARCIYVDNAYIIAIITTPFYLKSERDKWCEDMQVMLSTTTNSIVHLSLDLDIYRNIRQGMDDKDKTELLESVLSRKATLY